MLPSDELSDLQAAIEATLPDTCALLTATYASDGQGGFVETWGTATASIACRLDAMGGRKSIAGEAIQPYSKFVLTLPHDATITTAYRVRHNSIDYNVTSVSDGSLLACKRAILERV